MRRLIKWTGDMGGITIGRCYELSPKDSGSFLDDQGYERGCCHGDWEDVDDGEGGTLEADTVNHPPHYKSHPSGIECIQVTEHLNFCLGNAIKYVWRADEKHGDGGIEDLKKASWYINREIERRAEL